jgi:phosphoribosyl 1,2-cyclic phosphodiesterase
LIATGNRFFFTGDYEPQLNIYDPQDEEYTEFQSFIDEKRQEVIRAMKDADVLIIDSSYTGEEYTTEQGWGHGTYDSAIMLAAAAKVKKLFFTPHEPARSDTELEMIYHRLLQNNPAPDFELLLAQEGIENSI